MILFASKFTDQIQKFSGIKNIIINCIPLKKAPLAKKAPLCWGHLSKGGAFLAPPEAENFEK